MESLFVLIAAITLLYLIYTLVEFYFGFKQIKNLSDQPTLTSDKLPKVSIILSALNEEKEIEKALTTLLNLSYPNLEIIAINDRSSDRTPEIMDRLQKQNSMLTVHHITSLPPNWFGKTHALHYASQKATGDWLLFTDADVSLKKDTLLKALSYVIDRELDHLTIFEYHRRKSFWLKISLLGVYLTYTMVMKPWRIRYAWSKKSLGHGAFNLVKKSAYERCKGHQAVALECLDDLSLGAVLKKNGCRQDTVDGSDYIEREWYSSMPDMIGGLKKNSFAYYKYKLTPMLRDCSLAIIFYGWPVFAAIFFSGWLCYLNLINIALTLFASIYVAKQFRLEKFYALFYPLSVGILLYTLFNSAIATYRNKGVIWRGTHYSLELLKKSTAS